MNSFILFNRLYHCFCIPLARKNVHTQSKCGNPIDRNALMNGENVSMKPCNRLQDNRQKPRFIVHLDNKGDRLSPCLFMKWKNIIFVFVEGASADSCALCCILYTLPESRSFFASTTFSRTSGTARSLTTKYFFFSVTGFCISIYLSVL